MIELALRILVIAVSVAVPVWLVSHTVVLVRRRRPILYFELQQLGMEVEGDRLARLAFRAWNTALVSALCLFALAAIQPFI